MFLSDTGVFYTQVNENILSFCIENKSLLAFIENNREIKHEISFVGIGDFINDLSDKELSLGLEKIKDFCHKEDKLELLKEYLKIFYKAVSEETKLKYAKEYKKEEFNCIRDKELEKGVIYKHKVYNNNQESRSLIVHVLLTYLSTKTLPENFVWTTKENEAVKLNYKELSELSKIMINYRSTLIIKTNLLKEKVENSNSLEELQKIVWE